MIETDEIFENRKDEIDFYFSIMKDIDDETKSVLNTADNQKFFRIMKSNFILMLYNLVEATFTTGMLEIYEEVKQERCSYQDVIDEIQDIWRDYKIKEIYKPESQLTTYTKRVKNIVDDITESVPVILNKSMLGINGNLNAKQIKKICDRHKIRYQVSDDRCILEDVKNRRNSLAHGDESFSRCARDFTIADLEIIKNTVIRFMTEILSGMNSYYDNKQYLKSESR